MKIVNPWVLSLHDCTNNESDAIVAHQKTFFLWSRQTKPHKQPHLSLHFYQVRAQYVIWAHNLLKMVSKQCSSLNTKAAATNMTHPEHTHLTHTYLGHGHQKSSSKHTCRVHCTLFIPL